MLEYRTIAVYRSAISQTHLVDSVPLGELPIVSKFMKGVLRSKPPKPKYCSSWSVAKVLEFLRSQEPLEKLSLKLLLKFKLIVLLAVTKFARAHDLAALDLDFSLMKEDAWEFTIPEHVKNSRPGHPPRKFYLASFPQDNAICVVRVLRA